jgi:hypothetical protein
VDFTAIELPVLGGCSRVPTLWQQCLRIRLWLLNSRPSASIGHSHQCRELGRMVTTNGGSECINCKACFRLRNCRPAPTLLESPSTDRVLRSRSLPQHSSSPPTSAAHSCRQSAQSRQARARALSCSALCARRSDRCLGRSRSSRRFALYLSLGKTKLKVVLLLDFEYRSQTRDFFETKIGPDSFLAFPD